MKNEDDRPAPKWHYPGTFASPDPRVSHFRVEVEEAETPVYFKRFALPIRFSIVPVREMKDRPVIEVEVDTEGPRCVAIRARPGSSGLKTKALRLPIDAYLAAAVRVIAQEPAERDGVKDWSPALGAGADRSALVAVREGRRLNEKHLQRVAELYLEAIDPGSPTRHAPTRHVEEVFPGKVPRKTIERWIRAARKRGYLPPVKEQRKEKRNG
jgi:hypothetical protein